MTLAKYNETVPGGLGLKGKRWVNAMGDPIPEYQFVKWWGNPKHAEILEKNGVTVGKKAAAAKAAAAKRTAKAELAKVQAEEKSAAK